MGSQKLYAPAVLATVLSACGGASTPAGPTRVPTHSVNVALFYDENGNGLRDGSETVRLPNAQVSIGAVSARTDAGGRTTVLGVLEGPQTVTVVADTLPPYYAVNPVTITVPPTADVLMAATLPLGARVIRNKYMGFGDSLTFGTYEAPLESMLVNFFGSALVVDEGMSGTRSDGGAARVREALDYARPAHTLILYGTNDWNELACKDSRFPCYTIDSLSRMIRATRDTGSLPYLATMPPANVGINDQAPPERNEWTTRMNDLIRKLARDEGVVLVDLHKAFLAAPDPKALFLDHVHPSRQGQTVMAQEFFKAITQRQAVTAASASFPFTLSFSR
jgi:lysophospholipase L1-like esterase